MRESVILFVYKKGQKTLVFHEADAKFYNENLLKDGYKHIDTIDALEWIATNYKKTSSFCQCEKPNYVYMRPVCTDCHREVCLP